MPLILRTVRRSRPSRHLRLQRDDSAEPADERRPLPEPEGSEKCSGRSRKGSGKTVEGQ